MQQNSTFPQQPDDMNQVDSGTRLRSLFALCLGSVTLCICLCCFAFLGTAIFTADEVAFFPSADDTVTIRETIPQADTGQPARVLVNTNGDVRVGVADDTPAGTLLAGNFRVNVEGYRPDISDEIVNGRQEVRIDRQSDSVFVIGEAINEWTIDFAPSPPFVLDIGANGTELDFTTGTGITELNIESSAGAVRVMLAGDYPNLQRIDLDSSSGDVRLELDIETTLPALREINADTSSGAVYLDLRGSWRDDANVDVDASSGDIDIFLPATVGVDIDASTNSGAVRFNGDDQGEDFSRRNVVEAAPTLRLRIDTNSGDVTITQ